MKRIALGVCALSITLTLVFGVSTPAARGGDYDSSPGTFAQAVCEETIVFPTFSNFGDCVAFVLDGGAVGVRAGSLMDEQIVFALVYQNGALTQLVGVNSSSSCTAYGSAGTITGQEFTVIVAPGETNAVAIPTELGGVDVYRYFGDIPHSRRGAFGVTPTSIVQLGGGTLSGCF